MKNYLFLGIISTVIFFNSCDSNDENEPSDQKLFLSKVTSSALGDTPSVNSYENVYEYNSNGEIIKIISKYSYATVEYSNNKPVKINCYYNHNKLMYSSVFYYTGDQLSKIEDIYPYTPNNQTYRYIYNSNGQLASTSFCLSLDCSDPSFTFYTYSKNNIAERTYQGQKNEYFYDNKLSPYTYMNQYMRIWFGRSYMDKLNKNNITVDKYSYIENDQEVSWISTLTYEYNSSGYPVKVIVKDPYGNPAIRYDYEYITR